MGVIYHMELVKDQALQLTDRPVLDRIVDQGVRLDYRQS